MLIVETTNVSDASAPFEPGSIDTTSYDPANEVSDGNGNGDGAQTDKVVRCAVDPVDDANDGDDVFDPVDP